jgi:hypothetical protein
VGSAGQTVLMNAGQVVGVGLGGQRVGWVGHWVGSAMAGHSVTSPGVMVGPHWPVGSAGHWVVTAGHWVEVGWHSVGVFGVVVGPPHSGPTGHCVCWMGQTVCWTGHLVRSSGPGQTVGWVAIWQVVGWVAQTVMAVPHWVVVPAFEHVVAAVEH